MAKTTHFGYKEVDVEKKQGLVKGVFDSVAGKYDLMNDVMSMGTHRLWKNYTISSSNVKEGDHVLDIAGGTGDLAIKFRKKVGPEGKVILSDINGSMLLEGRKNLLNHGVIDVDFVQANAESLPFEDNTFDSPIRRFLRPCSSASIKSSASKSLSSRSASRVTR